VGVEHSSRQAERAGRQKARALIADYHEQQLLALLEHVFAAASRDWTAARSMLSNSTS
jgi:hypothetical protein